MKLYRARQGTVAEVEGRFYSFLDVEWDQLIHRDDLGELISRGVEQRDPLEGFSPDRSDLLAPIGSQEVWAAGVTYFRSRDARMEEAEEAGGGDFYDRVYSAPRPELFPKATPHRVVGHRQKVRIREDARWSVPEPELTLLVASSGKILGYTVGNDMSSRDIEGENPLYLPQAKVYDGCCALGPGILVTGEPLPAETEIRLEVLRSGEMVFEGSTRISEMKRTPGELVEYLYRENSFPSGCFLMTGTGIVPPASFALQRGDEIRISIEPIGTLVNEVA